MIKILFFASVRDKIGTPQTAYKLQHDEKLTAKQLLTKIANTLELENIDEVLEMPNLRCAINQTMADINTEIGDGDEVAFFPPVTGG